MMTFRAWQVCYSWQLYTSTAYRAGDDDVPWGMSCFDAIHNAITIVMNHHWSTDGWMDNNATINQCIYIIATGSICRLEATMGQ